MCERKRKADVPRVGDFHNQEISPDVLRQKPHRISAVVSQKTVSLYECALERAFKSFENIGTFQRNTKEAPSF